MTKTATGRLALADGAVFTGEAFGATGRDIAQSAEVVFNTSMAGYQESLTDPSYTGQILTSTFPLVGNYGINAEDVESGRVQVAGFVVRELARRHSNYRATDSLEDYLADAGVLGLAGVDTRAITRRLREGGAMNGIITDRTDLSDAQLVEMARSAPSMAGANLVPTVGCAASERWSEDLGAWSTASASEGKKLRVAALDCGAKRNILRNLTSRGCDVTLIPHRFDAAELARQFEAGEIDGLFVSNGPGDPSAVDDTIAALRTTIAQGGPGIPTFGICLGHQLLALALGATTFKLPFGHRGANQPVHNVLTGRVEITSQNHGFAVDRASLEAVGGTVTHVHLNDDTVAGFCLADRPLFSVQHHPEASPGPHDAGYLFDAFVRMMRSRKPVTADDMGGLVTA
ncbi:MAG: glutamine-hydrolyzing carbamoyl-phosphate synthase small subunit [Planctomycetota bacterium]